MFGTPAVNLHSPGPIGDTTPAPLHGTTLAIAGVLTIDPTSTSNNAYIDVSPGGNQLLVLRFGGVDYYDFGVNGLITPGFVKVGTDLILGNANTTVVNATAVAAINKIVQVVDKNGVTVNLVGY